MKTIKLNVLLGKTDYLASTYNGMLKDFIGFFKNKQGAFQGEKRTYTPREGVIDEPSKRKNLVVQTTVSEKFDWFKSNAKDYIDALFSVEATNSSGLAKAKLVVEGDEWGEFTSLELLRLKSLIESNDLKSVLEFIPVRSDGEIWEPNTNEQYLNRAIFQTPLQEGIEKTTEKEEYILKDPNVASGKMEGYVPQTSIRTTTKELGEYTHQKFTGQISQREKAEILKRRSVLLTSIIEALKTCNDVEVVKSELTSDKIFGYLLNK